MKESEFLALIRLLEDDDPTVEAHLEAQLVSMGKEIVPRLEEMWETNAHPEIQRKLLDIIHLIQSQDTIEGLKKWQEDKTHDLLQGWLLVTQYQYPDLDGTVFIKEINRLTHKIWLEFRSGMRMADKLSKVNRVLFETERYKSNRRSPYEPQSNFLNTLIQSKKGSPISLGLLYLVICKELDLHIGGINLPGYFVLTHPDSDPPIYIDVYNRGAFFHKRELNQFLKEHNMSSDPQYFRPNSPKLIILALIKHLMECFQRRKKDGKSPGI